MSHWTRREFLKTVGGGIAGAVLLSACGGRYFPAEIPGEILGAKSNWGHRLRGGPFPAAEKTENTGVVIVGGGIAGLSTAWALRHAGFEDFIILELDDVAGGNSRSGKNQVSAFPWGAHYVPLVNPESRSVLELFQELKVIEGIDLAGRPRYNEYFLCAEPEERLFRNGRWQDGLIPRVDLKLEDAKEIQTFLEKMEGFRKAVGKDGRRAFAIPVDESSRDPEYLQLDTLTMSAWLSAQGYRGEVLLWYVNYCCRDDYGAPASRISAWAGIHYFAARKADAANAESNTVLTWPAGNGWLVERLREGLGERLQCNQLVHRIFPEAERWRVEALGSDGANRAWSSRAVVYAGPRFTAPFVIEPLRTAGPKFFHDWQYAPWLVANLKLKQMPGGSGAPPAWDNVLYTGRGLGYVVATHQNLRSSPGPTVLTYYCPLDAGTPADERRAALERKFPEWRDMVLRDLQLAHPDIAELTERLDVWIWGHGMIQPSPGFLWGKNGRSKNFPMPGLHFAHSDMSGISIFEEAHERGVGAARRILKDFG